MPLSDRLDAIVDHKLTHVPALLGERRDTAPALTTVGGTSTSSSPPITGPGGPSEAPGEVGGVPVEAVAPVGAGAPSTSGGNGATGVAPPTRRGHGAAPHPSPPAPPAAAAPPSPLPVPSGAAASPAPPPPPAPEVPEAGGASAGPGAGPAPASSASGGTTSPQALEVLIRFIPVGVTSAYVAATAPIGEDQGRTHLAMLVLFGVLTGVSAWVGFAVRLRKRATVPVVKLVGSLRIWPKWQMFAGILAFASWGIAIHPSAVTALLPGMQAQVARTFAAIGVVIVGYLLCTFDELAI